MCDEFTLESEEANLARRGLDRRAFAALSAAGAMGVALAGCSSSFAQTGDAVTEGMVSIAMDTGVCDAFFVHPAKGTHPGIVLWPDIAGLRDAFKVMARSLASQGFAVLAVNHYYRSGPSPVMESFSDYRTPEGQAKIAPMRELLTPAAITADAKRYVAFLDAQGVVAKDRKIGTSGYCMGGPFTVRTAAAVPARVGGAVSLHGAGLVTPAPDSPHRLLTQTKASYLFAIARNDDAKQPDQKTQLRAAADAAGRPAEIEVYPADHGWTVPDSPAWDPDAADKAWKQMVALFSKL
ncbi:dienelactone hydrolase family protein [Novosphingobium sp. 9]|uniref:dienelactone hydrolase family protein n=1 Tax=Novosphingobium sp. 9 TaxID=2025349 RepID=UPI0021B69617|nr:dienelactone hydrolase family protein [Novosphingobium sp. 9]